MVSSLLIERLRLDLRSILIERHNEIGYPVRTSGGTYVNEMMKLGIPTSYYNPIKSVLLASSQKEVVFSAPQPETCVLDLRGVYQYLAIEDFQKGLRY